MYRRLSGAAGRSIIAGMKHPIKSVRPIFSGRIVQLQEIDLQMDDGKIATREFLHYPGAAVVLPMLADGSIVMIRNYRFAVDEDLWELPAGILEDDEDPADCAARKLTEETGYTAGQFRKLGQFYPGPGTADEVMHAYLATELTAGQQALEDYEDITVEVLPEATIRKMVTDGTIHDGKTIVTLAYYWLEQQSC